jgi:hypothetical protein
MFQRHGVWRGGALNSRLPAFSTGYTQLDKELPGAGWPTGALTEIMTAQEGIGELQLVLPAVAALTSAGKRVIWLAPPHLPYAPALAAAGVDLASLALVRAPGRRDALWAAEQALRAGVCHALLAWCRHARFDELRRLAVAAEASRAFVALFRPCEAAGEASPAALRLALEPAEGGAIDLHILKRRGIPASAPLRLPVERPVHALGRAGISAPSVRNARAPRRLGVPVHA